MTLDMPTISLVSLSATTILGLLLCFMWWRERSSALIGWWGVAQLVMASGLAFANAATFANAPPLLLFGQSLILLSAAIMWMAAREFEGRSLNPLWVVIWPAVFILGAATGLLQSFDQRLILASTLIAILYLMAAAEFTHREGEALVSRWPAILLLVISGLSYLAWMPLILKMPIREVGQVFSSTWMPTVILIALLGRIALAFVVLAIVKERQEIQQRMFALTDPLTGLPNRRALFESVEALSEQSRYLKGDPVSVLVFDLDHFKKINDTYGHRLGDQVLQIFSRTLCDTLDTGSIVGRLGGEEFAAILPGANLSSATAKAESVRQTFAEIATVIDGFPVAGTVSIGVASYDDIDCDIGALFHRADGALYAAKQTGRNRVESIGPNEPTQFGDCGLQEHVLPPEWITDRQSASPQARTSRRYRGSADAA
ncbi:MAG: GGDEF domain-containing protein [Hyphomicrobium sp.]|jgi:diguanylate cyclase (GGDEF)-like protein